MMADQPHERLSQVFGDLAIELQAQIDTSDTLQSIAEAAAKIVPGVRWAGFSLIQGRKVISRAPTGPPVAELDQLQTDLNEGPCLSALREHHTVRIDDMRTETRWPTFAREAQQRGVLSTLSFQLFLRSENLGALNLYSDEPGAFSEESVLIGEVLAQHAAVAMIGVANVMQFRDALASRDLIGQAKGMVMQRQNLTGIQAFNLLIAASQQTNIKLVDVARWLVAEHESHSEATPHGTASGPAKSFSPQPGRPRVTDTGPQLPRYRRAMADSARDRAAAGDRAAQLNEQVAQGHEWAAHAEPDSSGDLDSDAATKHRRAAGDDRRDAQTSHEEADTEHD